MVTDIEAKLARWDELFEDLNKIVQEIIPTIEKTREELDKRITEIEKRYILIKKDLDELQKKFSGVETKAYESTEKIKAKVEKETLQKIDIEAIKKELNEEIKKLRDEVDKVRKVGTTLRPDVTEEIREIKSILSNLKEEVKKNKESIDKLSEDMESFIVFFEKRGVETIRKKIEFKSPRIL
jgi:chromosome segregation ATPase